MRAADAAAGPFDPMTIEAMSGITESVVWTLDRGTRVWRVVPTAGGRSTESLQHSCNCRFEIRRFWVQGAKPDGSLFPGPVVNIIIAFAHEHTPNLS